MLNTEEHKEKQILWEPHQQLDQIWAFSTTQLTLREIQDFIHTYQHGDTRKFFFFSFLSEYIGEKSVPKRVAGIVHLSIRSHPAWLREINLDSLVWSWNSKRVIQNRLLGTSFLNTRKILYGHFNEIKSRSAWVRALCAWAVMFSSETWPVYQTSDEPVYLHLK